VPPGASVPFQVFLVGAVPARAKLETSAPASTFG
jgi:hypothetical protein